MTVSDNDRGSASTSLRINPISLRARRYKQSGQEKVDLTWNGPDGTGFDVYRNGARIGAVQTTSYTDINKIGPATYSYKVCASATSTCSNLATVTL